MSRDWLLYLDDLIESAEKIAHHYFSVEPQIVWEAATRHVPRILGHARLLRERFEKQAGR